MPIWSNTEPRLNDSANNLLSKIAQATASGSGSGALNFADNGTEAEVLRNGGTERVLITNSSKHLILSGRRISIDADDTTFAFVGATSKSRGSYFDVFGQDNPSFPGWMTMTFKNGGRFEIQSAPDDSFTSTELFTVHGGGGIEQVVDALVYAASVELDLIDAPYKTLALTGNVTLTTANLAIGRSCAIKIDSDASLRTLTFPAGWTFVGSAAPADIAASKTGILSLTAFGAADTDVVAAWAVEP